MLVDNPTTNAERIANARAHVENAIHELNQSAGAIEAVEGEFREDILVEATSMDVAVTELKQFLDELADLEEYL